VDRLGVTIADELHRKAELKQERDRARHLRKARDNWMRKHQTLVRSPEYQLARKWVRSKQAA
jgi:hypothetical protein